MKGSIIGASEAATDGDLRRRIGVLDAAAIYVGTILGSGIFVAPAAVAAALPGTNGLLLWLTGAVIAACGASCYAECAARLPKTGGFYVFYRAAFGEAPAFVGGWTALLVTYPASIAAIALVFSHYLLEAFPAISVPAPVPAAAAVAAAGLLTAFGVKTGVQAQRLLTGTKVTALAALCLAAILAPSGRPDGADTRSIESAAGADGAGVFIAPLAALLAAMVVVLWTYDGWSDVTLIAGEIRNPGRDIGRAVLIGTGVLFAVYSICQIAVSTLLTPERAAASTGVVAEAARSGLGEGAGRLVALLVVVSTFGSLNAVIFTVSRLGFAMSRDGVFPRWFGTVHPRWGSPARATLGVVAAILVYVFSGGFRNLVGLFSFSVWIFYATTAAGLIRLRRRGVGEPVAWRAPGGWVAPAVVILTGAAMTTGLMLGNPGRSLLGLAIILAGFPVHYLWRRIRSLAA